MTMSSDFQEGYLDSVDIASDDKTYKKMEDYVKTLVTPAAPGSVGYIGQLIDGLYDMSGGTLHEKGLLLGYSEWGKWHSKPSLEQKRRVTMRAVDAFCWHNGVNLAHATPIPPDSELASDNLVDIYNAGKKFAESKNMHQLY